MLIGQCSVEGSERCPHGIGYCAHCFKQYSEYSEYSELILSWYQWSCVRESRARCSLSSRSTFVLPGPARSFRSWLRRTRASQALRVMLMKP